MSTCYSDHRVFGDAGANRDFHSGRTERRCTARRPTLLARVSDGVRSWFADTGAIWRRRAEDHAEKALNAGRFDLAARDLMTRNVVTVGPDDSIEGAARLMEEFDCGALPVVDRSDLLLGIITDRDIAIRLVARGLNAGCAQVSDCMTDQAFACDAGTSMEGCMRVMSWFQVRRIPIVDADHRLIGIVSQSDIVRHARQYVGRSERRAMAEMLCAVSE